MILKPRAKIQTVFIMVHLDFDQRFSMRGFPKSNECETRSFFPRRGNTCQTEKLAL